MNDSDRMKLRIMFIIVTGQFVVNLLLAAYKAVSAFYE